jgi:phosphate/sulfate permease
MVAVGLLLAGYRFAREAHVSYHRIIVTVGALMVAVGFFSYMLESFLSFYLTLIQNPLVPANFVEILHVMVGSAAAVTAIYLAFRMWLFPPVNVGVNRRIMQAMLIMWFIAAGLGVTLYGLLYTAF